MNGKIADAIHNRGRCAETFPCGPFIFDRVIARQLHAAVGPKTVARMNCISNGLHEADSAFTNGHPTCTFS